MATFAHYARQANVSCPSCISEAIMTVDPTLAFNEADTCPADKVRLFVQALDNQMAWHEKLLGRLCEGDTPNVD